MCQKVSGARARSGRSAIEFSSRRFWRCRRRGPREFGLVWSMGISFRGSRSSRQVLVLSPCRLSSLPCRAWAMTRRGFHFESGRGQALWHSHPLAAALWACRVLANRGSQRLLARLIASCSLAAYSPGFHRLLDGSLPSTINFDLDQLPPCSPQGPFLSEGRTVVFWEIRDLSLRMRECQGPPLAHPPLHRIFNAARLLTPSSWQPQARSHMRSH